MNPTSHIQLRFPQLHQNQNFAGMYYVILLDDINALGVGFSAHLKLCGWSHTNDASRFLKSYTGGGPINSLAEIQYGRKEAYVKEVRIGDRHIPYGDVREALGMPREQQFARIREVTISLIFPHAMKGLPEQMEMDLHRAIEEQLAGYVLLGQEECRLLFSYGKDLEDVRTSVIVRARNAKDQPVIAVVSDRPEWQKFVTSVKSVARQTLQRFSDRCEFDQTIDTAVIC